MDKPKFVYVTYIATTPEKLFAALMDPAMTTQYWFRHKNVSDWKVGSKWEHQPEDSSKGPRVVGRVVEHDPPRRLVLTWADPADSANDAKYSRVSFDIEPTNNTVRLTVIHDELEPGSEMLRSITIGWPAVLSSLKSLLETGKALPEPALSSCSRSSG